MMLGVLPKSRVATALCAPGACSPFPRHAPRRTREAREKRARERTNVRDVAGLTVLAVTSAIIPLCVARAVLGAVLSRLSPRLHAVQPSDIPRQI